ncbi:TcaA NTF2-like domain-containing protein [Priestia megaterium]|uniref:TcaA NTF2-like domain-containing protein n=1 Tax=Priestia megaterium TaxID=1404 RepID=UPI000CA2B667|nr:protein kinase family protein [Priestia megaterium]AUO12975.1 protein kinase family protein [Priestia megaterium]
MKIEGYDIKRELFSFENVTVYEVIKQSDGKKFQLRVMKLINGEDRASEDRWYHQYEDYQLNINNYKYLPRVSTIATQDQLFVYALLESEAGQTLKEKGSIEIHEVEHLIDALRHLHAQRFVHGFIYPENIWMSDEGNRTVLYGAGEYKAISNSYESKQSSDITQLVDIISDYSTVNEEIIQKLKAKSDLSLGEIASILDEAKEMIPRVPKPKLVEREDKVIPTAPSIPEEKEEKPKPNEKREEYKEQKEEKTEKTNEEKRSKEKKAVPFVWKAMTGVLVVAVMVLLFMVGKSFNNEEPAPVEQTAAEVTKNNQQETPKADEGNSNDAGTQDNTEAEEQPSVQQEPAQEEEPVEEEEGPSYTAQQVSDFMAGYSRDSIEAVNSRNFTVVEDSLDPSGKAYKEQRDYLKYLEKKNITEESLGFTVNKVVSVDQSTYKVTTQEEYEIFYDDGSSKIKSFSSSYIVKVLANGNLAVNELLYTQELSSSANEEADDSSTASIAPTIPAQPESSSDDSGAIESTIRLHYGSISNENFSTAYNLFSSSFKQQVSQTVWEKGLQQNMYDELGAVEVKQIDANRATAYIEMTSYDDNNDGTTLVQKWVGNWNLVQEGGSWKLNKPELKKVRSRVEAQ